MFMNISFKYDHTVWTSFRKVAKKRYGLDGAAALTRLIDYVVRSGEIPGVSPLLAVESGDYSEREKSTNETTKVPY